MAMDKVELRFLKPCSLEHQTTKFLASITSERDGERTSLERVAVRLKDWYAHEPRVIFDAGIVGPGSAQDLRGFVTDLERDHGGLGQARAFEVRGEGFAHSGHAAAVNDRGGLAGNVFRVRLGHGLCWIERQFRVASAEHFGNAISVWQQVRTVALLERR
jgi:hypothetical protein